MGEGLRTSREKIGFQVLNLIKYVFVVFGFLDVD